MRVKILCLAAAALLLAACETTPTGTGSTGGTGAGTGTGTATQTRTGPVPGSQEDLVVNVGDRVFFDFDKYDVKPAGQQVLQKQAAWLKTYPNVTLTVEGHCDERGTREYNLALGERRATAVKNYLVALGINANRVRTISYGKERPAVLGSNEAAWSQNRRGVSVVN
ncbi:MAG: peptidoglycan-associated lipoprotein Pal [Alphaproteobacteria bacterium]|nr:peptidoglycan-associated lipoprotein Pal [Alphaproteobacteria bacterium]